MLYRFDTYVTARPFSNGITPGEGNEVNGKLIRSNHKPIERDSAPFESEAMINTPFLTDDDNEPIKRDEMAFDPEALINTPISSDDDEPIKRDEIPFDPEALINTPILLDDNEPIKRDITSPKSAARNNKPLHDIRGYKENKL